jgi:glutamine synthetase adenylyltransferase
MFYKLLDKLREEEANVQTRYGELINKRDELELEEQQILTLYRKKKIKQKALNLQLAMIGAEREEVEKEIDEKKLLLGNRADKMVELSRDYRDRLVESLTALNLQPETPDQQELIREYQRKLIKTIVMKVVAYKDRPLEIHTLFDFEDVNNEIVPSR